MAVVCRSKGSRARKWTWSTEARWCLAERRAASQSNALVVRRALQKRASLASPSLA
jgi:hypothetical protein